MNLPQAATPTETRFWSKVRVDESGCWLWTGLVRTGYGLFDVESRKCMAHRYSYELLVGPIPAGLELDHLCRVRACVRADHLEPVTHLENVRRGDGGAHWRAKTHCPQGHPYDEANTRLYRGMRYCRACLNASNARRQPHRAISRAFGGAR